MSKHDAAQVTARYIADLVRRRAFAAVAGQDARMRAIYDKIAAGIRKDLGAQGIKVSIKDVRDSLDKHFSGTLNERVAIVEDAIRDAAREGRKLDQETFEAVFGAGGAAPADPLAAPSSLLRLTLCKSPARESGEE